MQSIPKHLMLFDVLEDELQGIPIFEYAEYVPRKRALNWMNLQSKSLPAIKIIFFFSLCLLLVCWLG